MPRGKGKDMHWRWRDQEFRTIKDLSVALQCSPATVHRILAGKTQKPSSLNLRVHKIERIVRLEPAVKRTLLVVKDAQVASKDSATCQTPLTATSQ